MSRLSRYLLAFACPAMLLGAVITRGEPKKAVPEKAPAKIGRLVKQLGSDHFNEREAASRALEAVGDPALEALRKAAGGKPDTEIRQRARPPSR